MRLSDYQSLKNNTEWAKQRSKATDRAATASSNYSYFHCTIYGVQKLWTFPFTAPCEFVGYVQYSSDGAVRYRKRPCENGGLMNPRIWQK